MISSEVGWVYVYVCVCLLSMDDTLSHSLFLYRGGPKAHVTNLVWSFLHSAFFFLCVCVCVSLSLFLGVMDRYRSRDRENQNTG